MRYINKYNEQMNYNNEKKSFIDSLNNRYEKIISDCTLYLSDNYEIYNQGFVDIEDEDTNFNYFITYKLDNGFDINEIVKDMKSTLEKLEFELNADSSFIFSFERYDIGVLYYVKKNMFKWSQLYEDTVRHISKYNNNKFEPVNIYLTIEIK